MRLVAGTPNAMRHDFWAFHSLSDSLKPGSQTSERSGSGNVEFGFGRYIG